MKPTFPTVSKFCSSYEEAGPKGADYTRCLAVSFTMELRLHNSCLGIRVAFQITIPLVQITMELRIQKYPRSKLGKAVRTSKVLD